MSDIFERMMQNQSTSTPSSSSGGRPMHGFWEGYEKIKENGKTIAKCLKCSTKILNTGKPRMIAHR